MLGFFILIIQALCDAKYFCFTSSGIWRLFHATSTATKVNTPAVTRLAARELS